MLDIKENNVDNFVCVCVCVGGAPNTSVQGMKAIRVCSNPMWLRVIVYIYIKLW